MSITLDERTKELTYALTLLNIEEEGPDFDSPSGELTDFLIWASDLRYNASVLLTERASLAWIRGHFALATKRHLNSVTTYGYWRNLPWEGRRYRLVRVLSNLDDAIYRYCAEYLASVPGNSEMEYEHQCYSF